jgi:hypothetical protein
MSNLQWGTLKYILTHEIAVDDLKTMSLTTVGSLLVRKWITRDGSKIIGTKAGNEAYDAYRLAGPNYKQHPGELSDRVANLLHISALRQLKKVG